eukprot:UN13969
MSIWVLLYKVEIYYHILSLILFVVSRKRMKIKFTT